MVVPCALGEVGENISLVYGHLKKPVEHMVKLVGSYVSTTKYSHIHNRPKILEWYSPPSLNMLHILSHQGIPLHQKSHE